MMVNDFYTLRISLLVERLGYENRIDARLIHETGVGRYIRNLTEELGKVDDKNTYIIF